MAVCKPRRIAMLYDKTLKLSPSNPEAIKKFKWAAQELGMYLDIISKRDGHKLFDYDALFIRDTTSLKHYTYLMSKMAQDLDIFVLDNPRSIRICSDKVEQYKLFKKYRIPIPQTLIVDKFKIDAPLHLMKHPYVIKNPYGSFSDGVYLVDKEENYRKFMIAMLEKLNRVVVQEVLPTELDWRIGILNNEIIFACKYYMSKNSWKIIKHDRDGGFVDGASASIPIDAIPFKVSYNALRAVGLVGEGLYGVDIKMIGNEAYVIEVNDNPNIDAGIEDELLGDELYLKIMRYFKGRIDYYRQKQASW